MLIQQGRRTNYGYQYSPYECQYSLTLCPECQTNLDTKCRQESKTDPTMMGVCTAMAKNLCPSKCNSDTEACPNCMLNHAGVNYCAATGTCLCNGTWSGDGCEIPYIAPNVSAAAAPVYEEEKCDWWCTHWWIFVIIIGGICLYCFS